MSLLTERLDSLETSVARLEARVGRLEHYLHSRCSHPEYEYTTRTGQRKSWDGDNDDMEAEGWERNTAIGRGGWERFDYHEETYWKRQKKS